MKLSKLERGVLKYDMDFNYHVFDRYNWRAGKQVTFGKIVVTDEYMVEFHRQGLAKEYNQMGTSNRIFSWIQGDESQYQGHKDTRTDNV